MSGDPGSSISASDSPEAPQVDGRPAGLGDAESVPRRMSADPPRHAAPPVPETLDDTGLDATFVTDLLLKTLYTGGACRGGWLASRTRLRFGMLDDLLLELQQRHLIEVRRTEGHGRQGYVFDLTTEGRNRAREAMAQSRYVGPAPVPFATYVRWIEQQSIRHCDITPEQMRATLDHLVLDESFVDSVGAAANSGTALFLYGSPGNGKTACARALSRLFGEPIYVPYALTVEGGTIIQSHDPIFHDSVEEEEDVEPGDGAILGPPPAHDERFAHVHRPVVAVGGELTMDQLELQHDARVGAYRAPLQLKANGGIFLLDDFGRQRIPPRDLLNRWMVPLEERLDYLSLPTGHKLPVPFDCFLVFSTNLNPTDLVEEAFLRRLRYKIAVTDPTREQFAVILRRCCDANGLEFSNDAMDLIYRDYYSRDGIEPRACHPRDLLAHICDEARYRGQRPELTLESMERACSSYFLELETAGEDSASTPNTTPGS